MLQSSSKRNPKFGSHFSLTQPPSRTAPVLHLFVLGLTAEHRCRRLRAFFALRRRPAEPKLESCHNENFCVRRIRSRSEERRDSDETVARRMHVDARADEKFVIGFMRSGGAFVFPQGFDTDIQRAIDQRITECLTDLNFPLAFGASFVLVRKIGRPIPSVAKRVA